MLVSTFLCGCVYLIGCIGFCRCKRCNNGAELFLCGTICPWQSTASVFITCLQTAEPDMITCTVLYYVSVARCLSSRVGFVAFDSFVSLYPAGYFEKHLSIYFFRQNECTWNLFHAFVKFYVVISTVSSAWSSGKLHFWVV